MRTASIDQNPARATTDFRLILDGGLPGEPGTIIGPADLTLTSEQDVDDTRTQRYQSSETQDARLTIEVRTRRVDDETRSTIAVTNQGDRRVRQVQFPYVDTHDVETFDRLLMSTAWGDCIERPTKTIREITTGHSYMGQDYIVWRPDEVIYSYPSIMAMQYMVLFNQERSLYVASYSDDDSSLTFNARVIDRRTLNLTVNHYPFLKNGSWTSPECSVAMLPGGWHSAADCYSSRMRTVFNDPDLPAWMSRDFHGWGQIQMKLHGRAPAYRFRDLPGVFRQLKRVGITTLNIAGWAGPAFDMAYPEFRPNPELGTMAELHAALREIREMGCHAIFYTNGRLIDEASEFFQSGAAEVILKEDGSPYRERYPTSPSTFQIACPSSESYRDYFTSEVRRIVADYKAHALQIDQISCNYAPFCFDERHEHATPATNFLPGVEKTLAAVRAVHKELDPEFFVWCEGCHERFGQYYDVNQGHGEEHTWQIGASVPEQFLYTYPRRVVTGISQSIQQLCHVFAQGKPFDFPVASLDEPGFADLVGRFVDLRARYPHFYFDGTFVDCAGIEVSDGTRAFGRIDREGRRMLVSLWRPGIDVRTATRTLAQIESAGTYEPIYPADLVITRTDECLALRWTGPVSVFEVALAETD